MSEPGDTARLERLLRTLGLPLTIPAGMDTAPLLQWMRLDKKNAAGQLRLILWRGIGRAEIVAAVPESAVAATLDAAARGPGVPAA
jgi:3-dehydroquinate synthase